MGVYHFASRTKTRDKIATMFNILIINSSKKDTLESVETKNIYRCIIMLGQCWFNDGPTSTTLVQYYLFQRGDCLQKSESDVCDDCKRQIQTSIHGPRNERIKIFSNGRRPRP